MARALARCLRATEGSRDAYARAARTYAPTELGAWLASVAKERASFATALREQLAPLETLLARAESPELANVHATLREPLRVPTSDADLLGACDAWDREAQRAFEVSRGELARADVPREVRSRVDAQYAAVCNARFDLDRRASVR